MDTVIKVDGVTYKIACDEMAEDDVIKWWFDCTNTKTGECISIDCSPYMHPDEEFLKLWIRAGQPDRYELKQNGPIYKEDLQIYFQKKIDKEVV